MIEIEPTPTTPELERPNENPPRSVGWRKTYTSADVRALIAELNHPGQGWFPIQYSRLQGDPGGMVSAALNKLKNPYPEGVLFLAAQAAALAEGRDKFIAFCREQSDWYAGRKKAAQDLLDSLWGTRERFYTFAPIGHRAELETLAAYLGEQADWYAKEIDRAPLSRKQNVPHAAAIAAIRGLRERLYRNHRALHDPVVMLASAAIGLEIPRDTRGQWPTWVLGALRATDDDSSANKKPRIHKIKKILEKP